MHAKGYLESPKEVEQYLGKPLYMVTPRCRHGWHFSHRVHKTPKGDIITLKFVGLSKGQFEVEMPELYSNFEFPLTSNAQLKWHEGRVYFFANFWRALAFVMHREDNNAS